MNYGVGCFSSEKRLMEKWTRGGVFCREWSLLLVRKCSGSFWRFYCEVRGGVICRERVGRFKILFQSVQVMDTVLESELNI